MHYLVKWKGYPTSDNSWEPEGNLNADELIAKFKQTFKPKKKDQGKESVYKDRTNDSYQLIPLSSLPPFSTLT